MKNVKRIASLLLALVMVLSLAVTAFAAETYSITINNSAAGHTYEAYQIFTGDLSEGVLSNIEWGSSVSNAATLGDAADVAERLDTSYTGEDKLTLDGLLEMITLGDPVANSGSTSNPYVISGLAAGYYLVKDQDDSLNGKEDAYTEYIIKVVENVTATPKSDVPEFEKKVKDTNDTDGTTTDWQDSADYDIGDAVPFQLTATLPNNVTDYASAYKVVFHDTLSNGLTFNVDSVKVYVGTTEVAQDKYNVVTTGLTDGCTFEVVIPDVEAAGATNSSVITVEYTATLNTNAVVGSAGNTNVANLEYSNNPNWVPESDDDTSDTGETPEDKVIVFTYKVVVNKVDQDTKALPGAGFTLYKKTGTNEDGTAIWTQIGEEKTGTDMTTFTWTGLDDGDYKLVETTTPAGYNTIEDILFTITATHDTTSDDPKLTALDGGVLGTGAVDTGAISTYVVNKSGATLPETGGMGTTMFYIFGGIMVLAAVVLLVTKKRMGAAE